ncbi:MAG: hypothetical protein WA820_24145, partial [Bradyrhizobium sp.]
MQIPSQTGFLEEKQEGSTCKAAVTLANLLIRICARGEALSIRTIDRDVKNRERVGDGESRRGVSWSGLMASIN